MGLEMGALFAIGGVYLLVEAFLFWASSRLWFGSSTPPGAMQKHGWLFALHYSIIAVIAYVIVVGVETVLGLFIYNLFSYEYWELAKILWFFVVVAGVLVLLASRPVYFLIRRGGGGRKLVAAETSEKVEEPWQPSAAQSVGLIAFAGVTLHLMWATELFTFFYCLIDGDEAFIGIFVFEVGRVLSALLVYTELRLKSGFLVPFAASTVVYLLLMTLPILNTTAFYYDADWLVVLTFLGYFVSWSVMAFVGSKLRNGAGSARFLLKTWLN